MQESQTGCVGANRKLLGSSLNNGLSLVSIGERHRTATGSPFWLFEAKAKISVPPDKLLISTKVNEFQIVATHFLCVVAGRIVFASEGLISR